jgi:hypothetical protein
VRVPDFSDCTDQTDLVDMPDGSNAFLCSFASGNAFHGDVNWFPVTVEGHAGWGGHASDVFPFSDDDYTFGFSSDVPGNPLSVNGRRGLHVEFDAGETINHFTSDEWTALRDAVDAWTKAKVLVPRIAACPSHHFRHLYASGCGRRPRHGRNLSRGYSTATRS